MKEKDLQNALILNPELIEEGLTFKEHEVFLQGKRCDLLFVDKNGRDLYVEVKLRVSDRSVGQLIRYDGLVNNENARFMLVGLSIADGLHEGLLKHGYEYTEVKEAEVDALVSRLKGMTASERKDKNEDQPEFLNEISPIVLNNKEQIERILSRETKVDEILSFLLTENTRFRERIKKLEEYCAMLVIERYSRVL